MAGNTSGWFLRLRRHRLLQRLVELDVQAAHALGEPAELHVDAAAAPRHHGHRAGHVADGPDVRGERALPQTSGPSATWPRSEEHTSELQSRQYLVCRLLLEKKKKPQQCGAMDI